MTLIQQLEELENWSLPLGEDPGGHIWADKYVSLFEDIITHLRAAAKLREDVEGTLDEFGCTDPVTNHNVKKAIASYDEATKELKE